MVIVDRVMNFKKKGIGYDGFETIIYHRLNFKSSKRLHSIRIVL